MEQRKFLRLAAPGPNDWVFARLDGNFQHPDLFAQHFDKAVKRLKMPHLSLHGLRHSHATHQLQVGVNPKVVSERLGHSTVAITLDVYSHWVGALHADAADKTEALVFGAVEPVEPSLR
jgi:integrase